MSPGTRIDYKTLRQINPEAACKAVLEYLKTNGGNKADVLIALYWEPFGQHFASPR